MKDRVIVLIYGRGGHQVQMQRLLDKGLVNKEDEISLIAMTDSETAIGDSVTKTYKFREYRDKNSRWLTVIFLPFNSLHLIYRTLVLLFTHKVTAVITTGPGLAIIPGILFSLFRIKLVVFETWSKFYKPTITAKILYRFAGLFIIQNKSLIAIFPDAKYWGRL